MRLDGAELDQYGAALGRHVGYLPQEVVLFDGTVAENIARLDPDADDEAIVDAAKRTGAHEMILGLADGYDFQVSAGGAALSGGQRQRIALARAFYGSPVVVVMDEPDSNLDAEGTMALARAVEEHKKHGGAAVVVAHRHGAFAQCDTVYLMESGRPVPATSGGAAAPVRSLQSAGGEEAGVPAPPTPRPPSRPDAPAPLAAAGRTSTARTAAAARGTGRTRPDSGAKQPAARPVVRIVRGGQKSASAAQAAKPATRAGAQGGTPAQAGSGETARTAQRSPASARARRIAAAIRRVRGSRASTHAGGATAERVEPLGGGGLPDRRARGDDTTDDGRGAGDRGDRRARGDDTLFFVGDQPVATDRRARGDDTITSQVGLTEGSDRRARGDDTRTAGVPERSRSDRRARGDDTFVRRAVLASRTDRRARGDDTP